MVMEHPFLELENRGRRWAISFLGVAFSWPQATVNWRGSWFSWSMLIWGAQILCDVGLMILCVMCFLCLLWHLILCFFHFCYTFLFFFSLFQVHEVWTKHDETCLRHNDVEFCCPQWRQMAGARLAWRSHRLLEEDGRGMVWILS